MKFVFTHGQLAEYFSTPATLPGSLSPALFHFQGGILTASWKGEIVASQQVGQNDLVRLCCAAENTSVIPITVPRDPLMRAAWDRRLYRNMRVATCVELLEEKEQFNKEAAQEACNLGINYYPLMLSADPTLHVVVQYVAQSRDRYPRALKWWADADATPDMVAAVNSKDGTRLYVTWLRVR